MLTRLVHTRLTQNVLRHNARVLHSRTLHSTFVVRDSPTVLNNILSGGPTPSTQVKTVSSEGIHLADGRIIPSSCIFIDGEVFLWDVPQTLWEGWSEKHFEVFDAVVPKPEILLLGTGKRLMLPPPAIRQYLSKTGVQIDVMSTRNACSTYNLLAEEGRRIAAALVPIIPHQWKA